MILKGLYILNKASYEQIYGPAEREDISKLVDIYKPLQTPESVKENPSMLADANIILSGWGAPRIDEEFLSAAPNLEAVFYGAGSVRGMVTDALWAKDIIVTSSYAANAVPVAEYCVSQILFSLKLGWRNVFDIREHGCWPKRGDVPGAYGTTVGLISLGMIGRKTLELLRPYDVDIAVYSTSLTPDRAKDMGVQLCSLDEIFRISHVVSLHTPNLPETQGMITGAHFDLMPKDASFINTARGAVVNEPEMIESLGRRPDITAVLDVTNPEPPEPGSPLYSLPNVVMTPHLAGSMSNECRRMGRYAVDELERYTRGEELQWRITREIAESLA